MKNNKVIAIFKMFTFGVFILFCGSMGVMLLFDFIYNGLDVITSGVDPRLFSKKIIISSLIISIGLTVVGIVMAILQEYLVRKK